MRQHGTAVTYRFGIDGGSDSSKGCRCPDCSLAVAEYERERRQRVAPAYVGAATAREHVRFLSEHGVGLKQIVKRSGVSQGALWKLMYGKDGRPSRRIRRETHDAILAVQPADRAAGARVPAGPTWAIVHQLLERGWTKAAISEAIGQNGRALQLGRQYVTARAARAVAALLDQPVPPRQSRWGRHAQPQPEELDEPRAPVTDLPRPPAIDLTAEPWRRDAACRLPNVPPWIFFPGRGDHATIAAAKAVCDTCTAKADCLEVHLGERDGIWGGTTEAERKRIRRQRGLDDDQVDDESEVA